MLLLLTVCVCVCNFVCKWKRIRKWKSVNRIVDTHQANMYEIFYTVTMNTNTTTWTQKHFIISFATQNLYTVFDNWMFNWRNTHSIYQFQCTESHTHARTHSYTYGAREWEKENALSTKNGRWVLRWLLTHSGGMGLGIRIEIVEVERTRDNIPKTTPHTFFYCYYIVCLKKC